MSHSWHQKPRGWRREEAELEYGVCGEGDGSEDDIERRRGEASFAALSRLD